MSEPDLRQPEIRMKGALRMPLIRQLRNDSRRAGPVAQLLARDERASRGSGIVWNCIMAQVAP
jgi:hypothetical protein